MPFLDQWFFNTLEAFRFPLLDRFMHLCTLLGDLGIVWILLAVILLCSKKNRTAGIAVALSLVLSVLFCNVLLKNLVARPRPFEAFGLLPVAVTSLPHGFSFPSGHTTASFAAAICLLAYKKNRQLAPAVHLSAIIVAGLVAVSRVYLHLHFATDVIAGVALGSLCGFLATMIITRFRKT